MKSNKLSIIAILITVMTTSIAYASLSTTLQINGSATVGTSSWDIHFENLSPVAVSDASLTVVGPAPTFNANSTSINGVSSSFLGGPASVSYTFDVVNEGSLDAVITSIVDTELVCTPFDVPVGEEATALSFAEDVCNNISYNLVYSNDTAILEGDTLDSGEVKNLKITLDYTRLGDALYRVDVTGFNLSLVYGQN